MFSYSYVIYCRINIRIKNDQFSKLLFPFLSHRKNISSHKTSYNDNSKEFIFLSSKDCDLTNLEQTQKMFQNIKPDYVIHLTSLLLKTFLSLYYQLI